MTDEAARDMFGRDPKAEAKRMREFRKRIEAPFIRNQHGLWCPQCDEQITDWGWINNCDCCGYPSEIEDDSDAY